MKKFISVMLVAAMAVTALTGCGSNSGSSSKKDADKYYIGGIGPTTGATAHLRNSRKERSTDCSR